MVPTGKKSNSLRQTHTFEFVAFELEIRDITNSAYLIIKRAAHFQDPIRFRLLTISTGYKKYLLKTTLKFGLVTFKFETRRI